MAGGTEFDRGRLKRLVLYLSAASADDKGFGMVKLNKLLYRSDFESYRLGGRSITGATYERQEFGPVARMLPIVLDELAADGFILWHHVRHGEDVSQSTPSVVAGSVRDDFFTDDERSVIDRAVVELMSHGGRSVSQWSHEESVGWRLTPDGAAIPYETCIVASEPAPAAAVARLEQRVTAGDWV